MMRNTPDRWTRRATLGAARAGAKPLAGGHLPPPSATGWKDENSVTDHSQQELPQERAPTEHANSYYILLLGEMYDRMFTRLQRAVRQIKSDPAKTRIVVIVESSGGYANVAFKMANLLHGKCSRLEAVVVDRAASAATIFTLGCNVIAMTPWASIGPIDAQLQDPTKTHTLVSALDIVRSQQSIHDIERKEFMKIFNVMKDLPGMPVTDILNAASNYVTQQGSAHGGQVDMVRENEAKRALEEGEEYAKRLLVRYGLAHVNMADRVSAAGRLAHSLVVDQPTHGYHIDFIQVHDDYGWNEVDAPLTSIYAVKIPTEDSFILSDFIEKEIDAMKADDVGSRVRIVSKEEIFGSHVDGHIPPETKDVAAPREPPSPLPTNIPSVPGHRSGPSEVV